MQLIRLDINIKKDIPLNNCFHINYYFYSQFKKIHIDNTYRYLSMHNDALYMQYIMCIYMYSTHLHTDDIIYIYI